MSLKRRIVAYCPFCEKIGCDVMLVPYAQAESDNDYLCVHCWRTFSLEIAQEIHNRYSGTYRGEDRSKKVAKKIYVATDGFKTTDGRIFGSHVRATGTKLKHILQPL